MWYTSPATAALSVLMARNGTSRGSAQHYARQKKLFNLPGLLSLFSYPLPTDLSFLVCLLHLRAVRNSR